MVSAHMPFTLGRYPDEGDDVITLDDRPAWPGPLEVKRLPADLIECDVCHQVRDCLVVSRVACNVYICSDCLPEHVEELEAMP